MIRKMLKNRLPIEFNKNYYKFIGSIDPLKVRHHFTRGYKGSKHNDYLIYLVTPEEHSDIHDRGIEDQEEAVLQIIQNLISYIKYLESK